MYRILVLTMVAIWMVYYWLDRSVEGPGPGSGHPR